MKSKISIISQALTVAAILALVNAGSATSSASRPASAVAPVVPMGVAANPSAPLTPVGSGFTYQGSLKNGGSPANGQYDFQFTLYDDPTAGNQVGSPLTRAGVTVTGGLFTVQLDFGVSAFQGEGRWLKIEVAPAGGAYTLLSPRQQLTAAPYAMSLMPGAVISGTTSPYGILLNVINSGGNAVAGVSGGVYDSAVYGVNRNITSTLGAGVKGEGYYFATGAEGVSFYGYGLYGHSTSGRGVYGTSSTQPGGYFTSTNSYGVFGSSSDQAGVRGQTDSILPGVHGYNFKDTGGGAGVRGDSVSGPGVYGVSTNSYAGYFSGEVVVTGYIYKSGGGFKIDHPVDPANKYLYHSFVESPDMKNIYDGNVTTDAKGEAVVALPDWFEAVNKDFRYQLTPIGQFAQAIVSSKIKLNRFTIKTDKPNVEVSWQVTGIRKDAYAEANRIPVEVDKQGDERGKYLHPEAFGQPETMGIGYEQQQAQKSAPRP